MTETEFETVFEAHQDAVYRFAFRMTNSSAAAEDIAQDCFLELWGARARFDPSRGVMRPFLLGIARNLVRRRWRNEQRLDVLDDDQFVAQPVDVTAGDVAGLVARAIQALPPLQREVLVLAEYEEQKLEEIAAAVDAEVGTVKARLHRARENLRKMLAPLRPAGRE